MHRGPLAQAIRRIFPEILVTLSAYLLVPVCIEVNYVLNFSKIGQIGSKARRILSVSWTALAAFWTSLNLVWIVFSKEARKHWDEYSFKGFSSRIFEKHPIPWSEPFCNAYC